jgi:hypothetical protein
MIVFGVWHVFRSCPPQAIKVDQSNLEYYEKASGTFNESLSKGSAGTTTWTLKISVQLKQYEKKLN